MRTQPRLNSPLPLVFAICLSIALTPRAARALQPLSTFVENARSYNPDNRVARATSVQRDADVGVALGRFLPSLAATASYTRNQYEVAFNGATFGFPGNLLIQPQNQLDANVLLTVPVINVGAWEQKAAAGATRDAAVATEQNTLLDVERRVAQAYYQLVGNEALLLSARHSLDVAQRTADLARDKKRGGTASELDVQRAEADTARAEQDVATADVGVITSRRALASLAGIEPEPVTAFTTDDLHEELPLAGWFQSEASLPSIVSARESVRAAERNVNAADAAWLPTISATAQERFTNATSFAGVSEYYILQAVASWRIDPTLLATSRAQRAAAATARAREDGTRRATEDAIYDAWHQVHANIERSRAARAQLAAASLAFDLARDRYASGVATELDVLTAQQDAFRADVARIQADADLAYARAALRLNAGQWLVPRSRGEGGGG
jgi:outer membrane protein TolC